MKRTILLFVCSLIVLTTRSQDFLGFANSNYAGITGALINPANLADNRMKVDISLAGINFMAGNNLVGVRRSKLNYGGRLTDPNSLFLKDKSWEDTKNTSPTYYRNNFIFNESTKPLSVIVSNRIAMPSFMISLNRKNSIGFTWNVRTIVNVDGIGPELARLTYEEFKYPTLWVKDFKNPYLSVQMMAWADYGLSYARIIKEDGKHFFKAGATVKLLQGLGSAYTFIKDLNYKFFTDTSISLLNSNVNYGHSSNFDVRNQDDIKYKFESFPGVGFDFGGVYEYRPDYEKHKYDMDGETGLWRKDENKYKLKVGLSVIDIGSIKFNKGSTSNDFRADIGFWNLKPVEVNSIGGFDSLMKNFFIQTSNETTYRMALPTTINTTVDYHIWKPFYVNLTASYGVPYKKRATKVHELSNLSITPRFDHKWFGVAIPISYNSMYARTATPVNAGVMLRLGPLVLGTNSMLNLIAQDRTIYGADFYTLLKVPIPYGRIRDKDKDGISDRKDKCKEVPGIWEFLGCPDKDGDHIQDSEDKCPDVAGVKELQGCPDKDGDGITDAEDACPDDKGTLEFKGCPDRDGDKIIDKEDECPDEAGLAEFMGCPDKDGDKTPDKYDACPDVFGPKEYKGCPDKDGDTVLDKDDGCPDVAGPVENKGCPWPDTDKDGTVDKDDACPTVPGPKENKGCPPVKAEEQKILERAFASLEFATGKDIIKPVSFPSLNDLAKLLVLHKDDWKLKLSGHTDNQGNADKNMLLSEKRSKAVKAYLVKKGAVADNLTTEWFGQTQPIADNAKPAGRQKNRRVEMKVIYKQ